MDHVIVIDLDGNIKTLYTDKIDLHSLGRLHVERASNVEWDDEKQGWTVEFADGWHLGLHEWGGLCCGKHALKVPHALRAVFDTREEALRFEVDFLQARL